MQLRVQWTHAATLLFLKLSWKVSPKQQHTRWLFDDHRDADRTSELYLANQRDP